MLRFFNYFFSALGVIFFILLGIVGYLYFTSATPLSISPAQIKAVIAPDADAPVVDENPYLSEAQENMVKAVGVDPATLPTSLTDAQKACLLTAVGEARAREIIGGASPSMTELFKAKACL